VDLPVMVVRLVVVLPLVALLGLTIGARPTRADSASAEALFREGRELLRAGKIEAACAKLAASQKIEPSSGTLLNLADCHSRQGQTASAWTEFLAAARLARAQGNPTRSDEAERRARDLEARLSYLRVLVEAELPGLVVERDGRTLDAAELGAKLPVDPGDHVLSARAPGHAPWSAHISIRAAGELREIRVPALVAEGAAAGVRPLASVTVTPLRRAGGEARPATPLPAYLAGGVGIALVGVGGFFGLRARSTYHGADAECPTHTGCSPHALDRRQQASDQANVANVGIGAGVVAIGVGVALFLTGSRASGEAAVALVPALGPTEMGAGLWARF
jgi:hypothetical protein